MTASLQSVLAPAITIRPGAALGRSVCNPRPDIAQQLAQRTPIAQIPRVLGLAFNLCGHAHEMAATLAMRALGIDLPAVQDAAGTLRRESFIEHLRRMHLDWPRALGMPDELAARQTSALHAIASSPLRFAREATASGDAFWARSREWLQREWLGMAPADWLRNWHIDPDAWLHEWTQAREHWLCACLRHAQRFDTGGKSDGNPPFGADAPDALDEHPTLPALAGFGEEVLQRPEFAHRPLWQGRCRHTGTWTRATSPGPSPGPSPGLLHNPRPSASHMLACRLAEVVGLALGVIPMEPVVHAWRRSAAISSVPMARGRLMHVIDLDGPPSSNQTRVLAYRVIAPTEWNFHPRGLLAQAISALPALGGSSERCKAEISVMDNWVQDSATRMRAKVLMSAFDPCVPWGFEASEMMRSDSVETDSSCMN